MRSIVHNITAKEQSGSLILPFDLKNGRDAQRQFQLPPLISLHFPIHLQRLFASLYFHAVNPATKAPEAQPCGDPWSSVRLRFSSLHSANTSPNDVFCSQTLTNMSFRSTASVYNGYVHCGVLFSLSLGISRPGP